MNKTQWYIMSGIFFLVSLVFGAFARNRKNICDSGVQALYDYCMGRQTTFVIFGLLLFVLAVVFLILGIFEKGSKK